MCQSLNGPVLTQLPPSTTLNGDEALCFADPVHYKVIWERLLYSERPMWLWPETDAVLQGVFEVQGQAVTFSGSTSYRWNLGFLPPWLGWTPDPFPQERAPHHRWCFLLSVLCLHPPRPHRLSSQSR